jgi:hypothetical protein
VKRVIIIAVCVAVPLTALIAWVAVNTAWVETKIPTPLKGDARGNPFYAAQRFAEALGARTARDRELRLPSTDSVIVLSAWHWTLSRGRQQALEHWVESGGRLVVDRMLVGGEVEFERWSGIVRRVRFADDEKKQNADLIGTECITVQEEDERSTGGSDRPSYSLCDVVRFASLTSTRGVRWALSGQSRTQVMRVRVGQGSVTRIIATPFRDRSLFDGDHGRLFVAATQLHRGDEVHFLTEDDHPSLLALIWQYGSPVVILTLALIALLLWRDAIRFGPLEPPAQRARRSLAEQIRGTGQFVMRHGSESLHAAAVRALDEAAARRVPRYMRLSAMERAAALARLTGANPDALAAAIDRTRARRSHQLRDAIALVDATRRQTLIEQARPSHGPS